MRHIITNCTFSPRRLAGAVLIAMSGALAAWPALGQEASTPAPEPAVSLAMLPADFAAAPVMALPATLQDRDDAFGGSVAASGSNLDDRQLSQERGRMAMPFAIVATPQMTTANSVTLWDELPSPTNPTPRPQQLSNGNVQTNYVSYSR